jgi:hypothetical protein
MDRIRAAVGPVEQAQALGIPENDALRLFEMYAATVTGLMEKCTAAPDPAGYGSDLPPILQQLYGRPTEGQERKPTLHVLRASVHVAADAETVFTFLRWVPLARARGRKRKAIPTASALAGAGAQPDEARAGGSRQAGCAPASASSQGGDYLGDHDLRTLLEEVGGEELLLRELVAATEHA